MKRKLCRVIFVNNVQNYIQYTAMMVISCAQKITGIINVDFNSTGKQ
jgi:hypothetical protein